MMQYELIKNGNGKSLLLFFLGWSCDPQSLKTFTPKDWDILMLYDYRDLELPIEALAVISEYDKLALVAHSFGVWVANYHLDKFPRLETTIAINGTLKPVDDQSGIPQRLFDRTLRSIQKEGITTFNERMCGDHLSNFTPSKRSFDEQYEELVMLGNSFKEIPIKEGDIDHWKVAIICLCDQIFPTDHLIHFWSESSSEVIGFKKLPHFPFSNNFTQFITSIL